MNIPVEHKNTCKGAPLWAVNICGPNVTKCYPTQVVVLFFVGHTNSGFFEESP